MSLHSFHALLCRIPAPSKNVVVFSTVLFIFKFIIYILIGDYTPAKTVKKATKQGSSSTTNTYNQVYDDERNE